MQKKLKDFLDNDSLIEKAVEIAGELRKRRNYDGLASSLNNFVREKALPFD